jgi:transposase
MASLQRFSSHGESYWRIVESYRRADGRPSVRVLLHLGKAENLLARLQGQGQAVQVRSVSSGAVDALYALAREFEIAREIERAIAAQGAKPRTRDGLTVGQSLVAAAIARACHPASKRAFAKWASQTSLPERMGFRAETLTSQHFWDQMHAMPVAAIGPAEHALIERVLRAESLGAELVAYDTTNFFTHIASTNTHTVLAQRGHNKQRRHDLRQLGLALVVSEQGQIPLGHALYPGARPDVKTFAQELEPLLKRLRRLLAAEAQLTLVFDQGAESAANLKATETEAVHYVSALKPSHHRAWLRSAVAKLEPCKLASGELVQALKTEHLVHGQKRTVVVLRSPTLYEGQCRGLNQHLEQALAELQRISRHPRGGLEGARAQVRRICNRQYVREVLSVELQEKDGAVSLSPRIDLAARERLEKDYFGLRLLCTTRSDWSTARIIEAYRGQARAERAFRDLKDPWVCAFRPQYHWTDQKLRVHAFIALLGLLLVRVLLHRARKHGFSGTQRTLMQRLATVRTCTLIHTQEGRGRPRLTRQLEQTDPSLLQLARALKAVP